MIDSSSSEEYFSDESGYQIDEIEETSDSDHHEINVLSKSQELILEVINKIDNPEIQKDYLQKLKEELHENKFDNIQKQTYNLKEIFKKFESQKEKPITLQELKDEINFLKIEIENLRQKQKENMLLISQHISQNKSDEYEFLSTISKSFNQKWFVKVKIKIASNFQTNVHALFDTGADLNCIKEGIIPSKFFEKTKEKLSSANGTDLRIQYKIPNVCIEIQNHFYKIDFIVVKDLTKDAVLRSPFINQLKPFLVVNEGIKTIKEGQSIALQFV